MYKDYKKKSKFFALAEAVEASVDGVGLDTATYVTIKKSVKSSEWYKNLDDKYKESIDALMNTDHNIRLAGIRTTPLAGYADANGKESPTSDKWATVYDEVAMGLRGITATIPVAYISRVDTGANRIPKIPKSWMYDAKIVLEPTPVKTEPRYTNPKDNTQIPAKPIKGATVKKAPRVN